MNAAAIILGALGAAVIAAGVWLIFPPAAVIVLGVLLCTAGYLFLDDGRSS